MAGNVGRQWNLQSDQFSQHFQFPIDLCQHLMDAVENLLCGLVFRTVENWEDIIFLCVVVPAVFPDNLQGVRYQMEG